MGVFENKRKGEAGKKYGISYRDSTGKLRQKIVSNSRQEAERELRHILSEMDQGTHRPEGDKVGLAEYAENWIKSKRTEVREATWKAYRTHVIKHILSSVYGRV